MAVTHATWRPDSWRERRALQQPEWPDPAAAAAVVATFLVDSTAALWTLAAYAAFMAYFAVYSRHHLVAAAPEEEFEALAAASRDVR